MSIHFACDRCGHVFDIGDQLAGMTGRCKHCGHLMKIPAPTAAEAAIEGSLKLRPIEGLDEPARPAVAAAPTPELRVRPLAAAEPAPVPAPPRGAERPIEVLDPYHFAAKQARRVHLNPHYETRLARFVARVLRTTRDRLYLLTIALLVVTLIGLLFKIKPLMHLGTVGVIATNIAMLVDGIFYLVVIPFRHSLAEGLGIVFCPPYAVYYWVKHWGRMRKPVANTVRSFTPILLAGLAYLCYRESPVIWAEIEAADRSVEKALGVEPGATTEPAAPSITKQAKQVLGNEANIIQELAQPQ